MFTWQEKIGLFLFVIVFPISLLARISHSAKKRTAFLGHKLLFNDNLRQTKKAVRWKHSVASNRLNSSPFGRGR
jgi:hypothetical protein